MGQFIGIHNRLGNPEHISSQKRNTSTWFSFRKVFELGFPCSGGKHHFCSPLSFTELWLCTEQGLEMTQYSGTCADFSRNIPRAPLPQRSPDDQFHFGRKEGRGPGNFPGSQVALLTLQKATPLATPLLECGAWNTVRPGALALA